MILSIPRSQTIVFSKRNTTIDLFRVIAAFGVIAIHVPFSTKEAQAFQDVFNPFSVPFFYLASLLYFVAGLKTTDFSSVCRKTWWRILVPYLCWTFIYTALIITKNYASGIHKDFVFWRILFYGESSVQLYFLPQLVLLQLLAFGIFLLASPRYKKPITGILFIALGLAYVFWGINNNCFGVIKPIRIFAYLAAAFLLSSKISDATIKWEYILTGIFFVYISTMTTFLKNDFAFMSFVVEFPFGGLGLVLIAIGFPLAQLPAWLMPIAALTFGIYLSHVLFLEAFQLLIKKVVQINLYYNIYLKLLVTIILFIVSAFFTASLRKIPFLKETLLGEHK